MLDFLPWQPVPHWLRTAPDSDRFPRKEILQGSLYYPACGMDGRPVQYFAGACHSFVYADYGIPAETLRKEIAAPGVFRGYRLAHSKFTPGDPYEITSAWSAVGVDRQRDGEPGRYADHRVDPYVLWAVFDRVEGVPEDHGPSRFSLLYLAADGVPAYQALYHRFEQTPLAIAVIQPGEGFGWNWTHFFDPRQVLCRTVLRSAGRAPRYLLFGGLGVDRNRQIEQRWPGYQGPIRFWKTTRGTLGLWEREDPLLTPVP